jgi:hydrogenase maturation factor
MNLLYARLIEIGEEDGIRVGKVQVGGASKKVPLDLLTAVSCGDTLLICDGVAISKVDKDVSGDSRETD